MSELVVETADDMRDLGRRLAGVLRAGDLVLLTGDLGAGKTTLASGVGEGLGVRGRVTSPTFVIAREHPPLRAGGLWLVHVDAYRLGGLAELEDLDLDAALDQAVTLVEWGHGVAESLADDRLEVFIGRPDDQGDDVRRVRLQTHGSRWAGVDLASLGAPGRPGRQGLDPELSASDG